MRRLIPLLLACAAAIWSQDVRLRADTPIPLTVKMETPQPNPWTRIAELFLTGLISVSGAVIAVHLTTKRNATENERNRKHQFDVEVAKAEIAAKHRSEDRRWEFKNDVYIRAVKATFDMIMARGRFLDLKSRAATMKTAAEVKAVETEANSLRAKIFPATQELSECITLATVATADELFSLVKTASEKLTFNTEDLGAIQSDVDVLKQLLNDLKLAARKDLWNLPSSGISNK